MLSTDNRRLFWRLARRSIRFDRTRHLLVCLAVFLSSVMLFSVFTIGLNYLRNLKVMMNRLDGVTNAFLYAPTREQYEQIRSTPGVIAAGVEMQLGSESVPGTLGGEIPLEHCYYDQTAWEELILPTISDVTGSYPQDRLDVMLSVATLARLGIDEPEIGMTIPLTRDYRLCGWFTDYTTQNRVIRSEAGIREVYADFWGWDGCRVGVRWDSQETWNVLQQIPLAGSQYWAEDPPRSAGSPAKVAGMLGYLTVLILMGGYLFVSNILFLSVRHDIRFYGMLKTLGATPRQLRRLVFAKAFWAAGIGLTAGLAAAMALCLRLVPLALETLAGEKMGAMPRTVTFQPSVFAVTVLFVALTVGLSSRRPARMAGRISPVQALAFTGMPGGQHRRRAFRTGLFRMALHNVFRQKKQAVRVFASLTLGAVLILAVNSIFHLDLPTFRSEYDIELNSLVAPTNEQDPSPFERDLNQPVMEAITKLDGIEELHMTRKSGLCIQIDPDLFLPYAEQFFRWTHKDELELLDEYLQDYRTRAGTFEEVWNAAVTLELSVLEEYNKTAEQPVDIDAFAAGDTVLVFDDTFDRVDVPADLSGMVGQTIFIRCRDGEVRSFRIGGVIQRLLPIDIHPSGNNRVPSLLVSDAAMDRINPLADIPTLCINAREGQLEELDRQIQSLLRSAPGSISFYSAAQVQAEHERDRRTVALAGNGVCALMVLMGMLNYINVMATSIQTRRQELAIMESLGMTRRQLCGMVMWEGGIYAGISAALFLAGCGLLWAAFSNSHIHTGALSFSFVWQPWLAAGLVLAFLAVCPCISAIAYRAGCRTALIERMRETN